MATLNSKVVSIETINNIVYRVHLLPEGKFSFRAGQYLMIIMNEHDKRPFSLASIPSEDKFIELHISVSGFSYYTMAVINHILTQSNINIDIPHGQAWFREGSNKPIILIAGGTGFSYANAILYAALEENSNRDITFYWGGKKLEHLYDLCKLESISKKYRNLKVIPVIEQPELFWQGRTGVVLNAVLEDFSLLSNYEIYIAGRSEMVKTARKVFCNEKGASFKYFYSDAFEFM